MSKSEISWGGAVVLSEATHSYLIGRLLTLIDALGLKESQEKSVKDLISQEVHHAWDRAIYIPPDIHNAIQKFSRELKDKQNGNVPFSFPEKLKVIIEEIN